jgi:hypothetical protein
MVEPGCTGPGCPQQGCKFSNSPTLKETLGSTTQTNPLGTLSVTSDGGSFSQTMTTDVTAVQCGAPTIMFNGANIANQDQPTDVVVGQEIQLSGQAPEQVCVSATASQEWSKPLENKAPTIKAVGGYVASTKSASVTALPADTALTSYGPFYWAYPGSYSIEYFYTLNSGVKSPVSTATFNVTGPTGGTMVVKTYPKLTVDQMEGCVINGKRFDPGPWLRYGKVSGSCAAPVGTAGVYFEKPTYQNSSGGDFSLVQLISSCMSRGQHIETCSPGLDLYYPYPTPPWPSTDIPGAGPLLLPGPTSQSLSQNSNMFVMWQSHTANSIPVPLGYQTWEVDGDATCSTSCGKATNWIVTTNAAGLVGSFTTSEASQKQVGNNKLQFGYPTWTINVSPGSLKEAP